MRCVRNNRNAICVRTYAYDLVHNRTLGGSIKRTSYGSIFSFAFSRKQYIDDKSSTADSMDVTRSPDFLYKGISI